MHLLNAQYLAIAWCSVILLGCLEFGSCSRCSRIPERLKTERTPSTGHFRIRLSETSGRYKPGRQYTSKFSSVRHTQGLFWLIYISTVWLESTNAYSHYRDRKRHTFTGFFLAVERKGNVTSSSDLTEVSLNFTDFSHWTKCKSHVFFFFMFGHVKCRTSIHHYMVHWKLLKVIHWRNWSAVIW